MSHRLLDRYLFTAFARIFALTAVSAPLLFIIADATERLANYLADGLTPQAIARLYLAQVPTYLVWAFPLAGLIATLFTLQPLVRRGEIAAALAGGIPLLRLFRPLFLGALAASLLGLALLEASPRLGHGSRLLPGGQNTAALAFAYLTDAGDVLTVQRRDTRGGSRLFGVVLRPAAHAPGDTVRLLVADEARWVQGEGWTLHHGQAWSVSPDGNERAAAFEALRYPSLREGPRQLLVARAADPAALTFAELARAVDAARRSGERTGFLSTELWQRVTIPLSTLVIVLFAAPLGTIGRPGEAQRGLALALVVAITYLAIVRFSEAAGAAGLVPASVAALLPILLFGAGAVVLLRSART